MFGAQCFDDACRQTLARKAHIEAAKADPTPFLKQVGTPSRYWGASIEQFSAAVQAAVPKAPTSVFCYGGNGAGKTHLATALLAAWIPWALESCRINAPLARWWWSSTRIMLAFKDTFNRKDRDEAELLDEFVNVPLLLIDDFGAEQPTDYGFTMLLSVVSERTNWQRPTIATSNLTLDEWQKREPRIASRLAGMKRILLDGPDRRLGK
jgi:DNA replication protein DnaC